MPAYPTALTNKSWQKDKGLMAKTKATGIGEALKTLEKTFQSSAFAADPDKLGTETVEPVKFGPRYENLDRNLRTQSKHIDADAANVLKKITAAKTTFAGNKSVLAALGKVESDLVKLRANVKVNGPWHTQQMTAVLNAYKKLLHANNGYIWMAGGAYAETKKFYEQVLADVKALEKDPRVDKIHELWSGHQPAPRSLRTNPRGWDDLVARYLPVTAASIRAGKSWDTFNRNLPWIDDVGNEQGGTASARVRAMIKGNVTEERAVTKFALEYSKSLMTYRDFVSDLATLDKLLKKYA